MFLLLLLQSAEYRRVHIGDLELLGGRCRGGAVRYLHRTREKWESFSDKI